MGGHYENKGFRMQKSDPYNRPLKIQESIKTLTPKVGVHSFTFSYILESMKCDSRASLLACTFVNLCFSHKPKARVATIT